MHGCWLTGMVAIYESSKGVEESKVKGTGNITPHQVGIRCGVKKDYQIMQLCTLPQLQGPDWSGSATQQYCKNSYYPSSYQLASCPCAH